MKRANVAETDEGIIVGLQNSREILNLKNMKPLSKFIFEFSRSY